MRSASKLTVGMIVVIAALIAIWEMPRANAQQGDAQQGGARLWRRGTASEAAVGVPSETLLRRLREGVVLSNQLGTFATKGDRIAFQPQGEESAIGVLENLALERVWKMLDDTGGRQWSVSGTVTEYRGQNFLLLNRAVLRTVADSNTAQP